MERSVIYNICIVILLFAGVLVSAKSVGVGTGEEMGIVPFEEHSRQGIRQEMPSSDVPVLTGNGIYSTEQLLFDDGFGGNPNQNGSKPLGGFVPVDEMPWVAVLVGAMVLGMGVWWRGKS
ncbi:MAG: hypothetical protein LBC40_03665 [Dysgonamonadaceae bacterium]|jgi:hypothetical protein|nr:hypothetical protein [Dysgonamonadaceae bacterium]